MGKKRLRREIKALREDYAELRRAADDIWGIVGSEPGDTNCFGAKYLPTVVQRRMNELQEWRNGELTTGLAMLGWPESEERVCSGIAWEVCGRELFPVWEVNAGVPGQRLTSYPDPRFVTPCATMAGCRGGVWLGEPGWIGVRLPWWACMNFNGPYPAGHTHPCSGAS